jgi:prepilin-type N-terminal cleavage/methylation domain-containing protein/prepilin-type processing-associated H-X9-DG protein
LEFLTGMNPARISSHRSPVFSSRGFTLIELLTVIAIIGVLAAIIFVSMGRVREATQKATCLASLRQFQTANMLHAADNRGNYVRIKTGDQWWLVRDDFTRYLNTGKKTANGSQTSIINELKCPAATELISTLNSWERENFTGHAYAANGATATGPGEFSTVNQNTIVNPAKTMAFADGLDFYYYRVPPASYKWEAEQKTSTTISYRHRDGSAVVYLDGHSEYLRRDQIEPIAAHNALWNR